MKKVTNGLVVLLIVLSFFFLALIGLVVLGDLPEPGMVGESGRISSPRNPDVDQDEPGPSIGNPSNYPGSPGRKEEP